MAAKKRAKKANPKKATGDKRSSSRGPSTKKKVGNGRKEKDASKAEAEKSSEAIDMDQAIAILKTTRPTFYRWLKSGKIKGMKAGRQWRFYREDIERFMRGEEPRVEMPVDIEPLLEQMRVYRKGLGITKADKFSEWNSSEEGLVTAVNFMILLACAAKATDIHVDACARSGTTKPAARLRFRVDGALQGVAEFDLRLMRPIVERWKRMSNCDLHVTNRPQDSRIEIQLGGRPLDVRITFLPAAFGEGFTARLLDGRNVVLDLKQIDFSDRDRECIERALRVPWGMILCTGPTGSGKTTTLYSCLNRLCDPTRKVMSIEDPVDYFLPGVIQVPVKKETSFPALARAALRSDPDVLMIGELRDEESVQVALEGSLTGHVVLSTLHTDEAAGALIRMRDIGVDPFAIGEATRLVIAQRLVRKLCRHCRKKVDPPGHQLERAMHLARTGGLGWDALLHEFHEPKGCSNCNHTGYKGRTIIAETLEISSDINAALNRGAGVDELRTIAVGQGMCTLSADGVGRAAKGDTTLSEVLRHAVFV